MYPPEPHTENTSHELESANHLEKLETRMAQAANGRSSNSTRILQSGYGLGLS